MGPRTELVGGWLPAFLIVVVLAMAGIGGSAAPAAAVCAAPTLERVDGAVGRGRVLELRGEYWGESCYDTGPPPDGQGSLGEPSTDLPVVLEQGGRSWTLGTVDADDRYGLRAEVVVPADAEPGAATVVIGSPSTRSVSVPVLIAGDAPVEPPEMPTVPEPDERPDPDVHDQEQAEDSDRSIGTWLIVAAAAAVVVVAAIVLVRLMGGPADRD